MKITSVTIIFFLFSCLVIWWIVRKFKKERVSIRYTILWIAIWAIIGIASIFPSGIDYFMKLAQMENRMFFILVIAAFILFDLVFVLNSKIEKMQRDNIKTLQEMAILKYIIKNCRRSNHNKEDKMKSNSD